MITTINTSISDEMIQKHLNALIGQFYKILPIKESGEPSLCQYMSSFQRELLGMTSLIEALHNDALYLSLIAILEYLIKNDCDTDIVKTEVFKAISICKKLQRKYAHQEASV